MGDERFENQPPMGVHRLRVAADAARRFVSPREKYLKDWKIVKRARFNAAKRFERKYDASTLAFALAGIFGFLIPFGTSTFGYGISAHTKSVLDFTALIAGASSLVIGLIEQAKDYPAKARRFHQCGQGVNRALRRMTILTSNNSADLEPIIADYEQALKDCGDNHDDIDHEIARAQQAVDEAPQDTHLQRRLAGLRRREASGIYGLYVAIWVLPLMIGVLIWFALEPPSATEIGGQIVLPQYSAGTLKK